jgi:hypothetical protein
MLLLFLRLLLFFSLCLLLFLLLAFCITALVILFVGRV